MQKVAIYTNSIALQAFMKWAFGLSGGIAKQLIQDGQVKVNGHIELQRSKKVFLGDLIEVADIGTARVSQENGG